MKKSRMALTGLAVAAGLLIPAGMAHAATSAPAAATSIQATGVAASPTISCRSNFAPVSVTPDSAEAVWAGNGCGYQGRVHIKCIFSDDSTHDYDGGWVVSNYHSDEADCAPGSTLIAAAWQDRGGPGQPVDTDWFWP